MKRIVATLLLAAIAATAAAQVPATDEHAQTQWLRTMHHRNPIPRPERDELPLLPPTADSKASLALPGDRVWFPGEWEEVKAVMVAPLYNYLPVTDPGVGRYSAEPLFRGLAQYYIYDRSGTWQPTNNYGPYRAVMDTASRIGQVFFYLMDGIQQGHAEAWVRVEQRSDTAKVLRKLASMGLRNDSVRFIVAPGNSFWLRDCGPICFYHGEDDSLAMMDFEYYNDRVLDDSLSSFVQRQMGIPNYINTFEWEGGNCLTDGAGMLITSDRIYSANGDTKGLLQWDGRRTSSISHTAKQPLSRAQTRNALASLIGQRQTHVLPAFEHDGGTGHVDLYVDMWDENGVMYSAMPQQYAGWDDYATGQRNIDSICSFRTIFDSPYSASPIPFPSKNNGTPFASEEEYGSDFTRSYSNHTFVNGLILQPCFSKVVGGEPSAAWDRENINRLREAYPGYRIYPVDVRPFDGLGGAIHCVTKQIPADSPVRILHKRIAGNASDMRGHDIPVGAVITNNSGIAHAECVYRIAGGEWDTVSLQADGNKYWGRMGTAGIDERVMDTAVTTHTRVDSTLTEVDTIMVVDSTLVYDDVWQHDSVYVYDTSYSFVPHYRIDTVAVADTVVTLHDTLVRLDYYLSATTRAGKTITKPMTAGQGGYYSFYMDGTLQPMDSSRYDFDTANRPLTDITFTFDDARTRPDTGWVAPLGIGEQETEPWAGQFFPNPAKGMAMIGLELGEGEECSVKIVDLQGRTLHTSTLKADGSVLFSVDTQRLGSGVYLVVFRSGERMAVRRLAVE